ncbi:MAG: outer membrane beta-barrel family protein [Ferruginibacter sp.]
MQKSLLFILSMLLIGTLNAQVQRGSINGNIRNAENNPLPSATIQLLGPAKRMLKGAVSDKAGNFSFENIPEGKYSLQFSAVGFENKTEMVEITAAKTTVEHPSVQLSVQPKSLGGVTVVSTRPLFEQKVDRMVVNVDASPSNAGATALEVLEKSPGVTVDNDGNISLKGKQGVIVMMDGKPTYLSPADLANVLRNLPAAALDRIEIMTNPSAKYDAAGNSGIIDIRTKKSKAKGSNGSITAGNTSSLYRLNGKEEILQKPTVSVNYNYKKNKINFFGNLVYNYGAGRRELDILSRLYREGKQIDSLNYVVSHFRGRNNNYTLKTGIDYSPDKKNTFGIVLNGFLFEGRPSGKTFTSYTNLAGQTFSLLNSTTSNKVSFKNGSVNLNYRHVYDSTGKEISLDLDYANYKNRNRQMLSSGFFDGSGNQTSDSMYLRGYLPSFINIYSVKSDFIKPFQSGLKIEAGIKSSYVKSDNLVDYERLSRFGWVPDSRNNHFVYEENINAAYLNANKKVGKWDVQTGLRAENTITKGVLASGNSTVKRNYVSLFPSAFLSYPMNKKNTLTVSASRRLQRPNYQDLNPFTFFLDSLSYRKGNPYLTPQFSYNYELTHNYAGKLITTLNYTKTTDLISRIIVQEKGARGEIIGFLTTDNIAKATNIGLAVTAPVKFKKWWNANFYVNVYNNHYAGTYISTETGKSEAVPLDLKFTSFTFNIANNFTLGKGWSAELSGFYRYKTIEQLSLTFPLGQINMGLAKNNLLKGRGTLRLNARDPFNFQKIHNITRYGTIDIDVHNRFDNRQYGVNFTYRFGKQQQGQSRRKVSATEDEQRRVGGAN